MSDPSEPVPIYSTNDLWEARAMKQTLEFASIPCFIEGENTSTVSWWSSGRMRLFVRAEEQERALEIIHEGNWPSIRSGGR